ncbi:MAG: hypothetical protein RL154_1657 [Pseudomonadota bacterium]
MDIVSLNRELENIEEDVNSYRASITTEKAIWLFVATTGCLGISNNIFQFAGLVILMYFYLQQMPEKTFKQKFTEIEKQIPTDHFLYNEFKKRKAQILGIGFINHMKVIKNHFGFFISFIYYDAGLIYSTFMLFKNIILPFI